MKRFGFHRQQLHFNFYNSRKVQYWRHPTYGSFECPKTSPKMIKNKNPRQIKTLVDNYYKRLDFQKYMNPKGLKPTITSNFPRLNTVHDYLNQNIFLVRSKNAHIRYGKNGLAFKCNPMLSKLQVHQYLSKLYGIPITSLKTVNKMGRIMKKGRGTGYWRKKDWKKAILDIDFDVDPSFQSINV